MHTPSQTASDQLAHPDTERQPGGGPTHLATSLMLALGAALSLARVGRDALFLEQAGVSSLPIALAGAALLAVPMAVLLLSLSRRLGVRRARLTALSSAALLFLLVATIDGLGRGAWATAVFVMVPVLFGGIFSLAWLLVSDLAATADAPRVFGRAGAATLLGGVLGAASAQPLSAWITPRGLFVCSALLLVGSALVAARADSHAAVVGSSRAAVSPSGFGVALSQPYVRVLLRVAVLAAAMGVGVEYQFYRAASNAAPDARLASFANVYLAINGVAFVVQWLVLPHLQRRVGLTGVLLVMPLGLMGLLPVLAGTRSSLHGLLRLAEGGLKLSTYRAGWEQSFLPIAAQCRTEAKLLVDGIASRLAEALCAAGVGAWIAMAAPRLGDREPAFFLLVLALVAAAWTGTVIRARQHLDGHPSAPQPDPFEVAAVPPHG